MAMKTYVARITLKTGGSPLDVRVEAKDSAHAKRLIEAQYGATMKGWFSSPRAVS
jgi:hypothetical protein